MQPRLFTLIILGVIYIFSQLLVLWIHHAAGSGQAASSKADGEFTNSVLCSEQLHSSAAHRI
jgi:hypothetical protein